MDFRKWSFFIKESIVNWRHFLIFIHIQRLPQLLAPQPPSIHALYALSLGRGLRVHLKGYKTTAPFKNVYVKVSGPDHCKSFILWSNNHFHVDLDICARSLSCYKTEQRPRLSLWAETVMDLMEVMPSSSLLLLLPHGFWCKHSCIMILVKLLLFNVIRSVWGHNITKNTSRQCWGKCSTK